MFGKYLNPQNDVAFKRLFGTERNKDILLALLNSVLARQLREPITNVTFLTPFQEPDVISKKQSIVDVLCQDRRGTQYIIEMQVVKAKGFERRAYYYASKAFSSQLLQGEDYTTLKEIIFLAFCNFHVFPHKKTYKSEHITIDRDTGDHDLKDFSFTFVDLPRFDKQRAHDLDTLTLEEKFYYFLLHAAHITPEQFKKLVADDQIMVKAYDELERFHWSEEEVRHYEQEEKRVMDNRAIMSQAKDEGREEGIKQGMEKGMEKKAWEMAQQLLEAGVDPAIIIKTSGLTPAQVQDLALALAQAKE